MMTALHQTTGSGKFMLIMPFKSPTAPAHWLQTIWTYNTGEAAGHSCQRFPAESISSEEPVIDISNTTFTFSGFRTGEHSRRWVAPDKGPGSVGISPYIISLLVTTKRVDEIPATTHAVMDRTAPGQSTPSCACSRTPQTTGHHKSVLAQRFQRIRKSYPNGVLYVTSCSRTW